MADITPYLANKLLDHVLKHVSYTSPTTVYVSLHTADPTDAGTSEVTGGSYARQAASFASASGKVSATNADLTYTNMPACTVTHVGIWDNNSGGNLLFYGPLIASQTLASGNTFTIASGNLTETAS